MKTFAKKSLLFFLLASMLLGAVEMGVRSLPNTYRYKENWMQAHSSQLSTLFLGNSHGYFSLRPDYVDGCAFNLCNVSQSTEYDYYLLRRYGDSCRNLRTVVLIADNSNLFDEPLETLEPCRIVYYQLYMGCDKYSSLSKHGFELSFAGSLQAKLKMNLSGRGMECDSLGWGTAYSVERRDPNAFLLENIHPQLVKDWHDAERNRLYVMKIAEWCHSRGIRLVLLMTPMYKEYFLRIPVEQMDFILQTADDCVKRYAAVIANYMDDDRFQPLDFYDPDHLSDRGADKFSTIFNNEYLRFLY